MTIKAVIRDETRAKTVDRLHENQEETGGSSAPQSRSDPNQDGNLPAATALATTLDDVEQGVNHRGLYSCSTGADLPNV